MKSNWFQSRFIGSTRLGDKIFCLKNRFSILKLLYTLWDEWILVKVCQIIIPICLLLLLLCLITSTYIYLSVTGRLPLSVCLRLSVYTFCISQLICHFLSSYPSLSLSLFISVLSFYRSLSIFHSSG